MNEEKTTNSKMAMEPVGKLMMTIGFPIVFSMMLQAAYNIVDSAYLSNMREAGEEALTALGLAFPVQLLMIAMAVGTGVGANALLSKAMGQGDIKKASRAAGNAILMGGIIFLIFLIFGIFGVPAYVDSQNAGGSISQTVLSMTIDYLRICCCVSFGIVFFRFMKSFCRQWDALFTLQSHRLPEQSSISCWIRYSSTAGLDFQKWASKERLMQQ